VALASFNTTACNSLLYPTDNKHSRSFASYRCLETFTRRSASDSTAVRNRSGTLEAGTVRKWFKCRKAIGSVLRYKDG
jgi:hypothetical protein